MSTEGPADALVAVAPPRVLQPGEVLMRVGDRGDEAFQVVSGQLEILSGDGEHRIDLLGPGATVGEVAMLAGCPRTATARALDECVVRPIARSDYERWVAADDARWRRLADAARARIDRLRLVAMLAALLDVDDAAAAAVAERSTWVRLDAADPLFAAGDPSDAAYLIVSGRVAVVQDGRYVREVARGDLVGELGLIERAPRSATVVALRETTLARFDLDAFGQLTLEHPALMLQVSRTVLARLGRPHATTDRARSIVVAVTAPADPDTTAARLTDELARHGTARHLSAARIDGALHRPGLVESGDPVTRPAVAEYLHDAETDHDYLLLEADRDVTHWTRTALALADRIVVVMSADPDDGERRRARAILAAAPAVAPVERWLALVHPAGTERPSRSAELADGLGFDRVAHLRHGSTADLARLARLVSGNATGLVLGGGGARGFAHIGTWRALQELGIEIDAVGGASIGAPLGVMMALQFDADALERIVASMFHGLLDYTVPVVSLLKGGRIARNIDATLGGLDVRDTWLPFFCVSTNLTHSRVQVHDRLSAARAVRASVAIPGVLPPVPFGGDLLVDGGVLNNLPCDIMRATGTVGRLIAVDLTAAVGPQVADDYGPSVSGWRALRSHLRADRSRYPGIVAVIMRAMVAGSARDRARMLTDGTIDCYLDLDLHGVQLLDFERVAEIARRGHEAARPRLAAWQATLAPR